MKFLLSTTGVITLALGPTAAWADPEVHLPGRTAIYVDEVCSQLVPDEYASVGECASAFRANVIDLCNYYAELGYFDVAVGRCVEVFSVPPEEGDE